MVDKKEVAWPPAEGAAKAGGKVSHFSHSYVTLLLLNETAPLLDALAGCVWS
jgi:hypothetical protein